MESKEEAQSRPINEAVKYEARSYWWALFLAEQKAAAQENEDDTTGKGKMEKGPGFMWPRGGHTPVLPMVWLRKPGYGGPQISLWASAYLD